MKSKKERLVVLGLLLLLGSAWDQMKVSGFRGSRLVNSFVGGAGRTATLTSPPFRIERRRLSFLIGGGKHPGETCINLLVDGKVVRTATGPNDRPGGNEALAWQTWDVSELAGKMATLQIVDQHTGGWGHINVDHIVMGDETPVEELKMELIAEKRYLNFPVKNGAPKQRILLRVDGKQVHYFDIELADEDPDFWVFMDIAAFKGKKLTLTGDAIDKDSKAPEMIAQSDAFKGAENLYREKYRPQFHFTSRRGWNNDPNGLVYYAGEYHLFYQHNPYGWAWGNMHWGHAVSPDLFHWTELGDAICPDELGTIFSGSAVVDVNNTAGFQTGGEKLIVCIYTSAGSLAPEPVPFTQSIAYSNDRVRTWTKYDGNPVLDHLEASNRDPKVIWHEPSKQWVMAIFLDRSDYVLFTSPNLKTWTKLCDIELPECGECPDIFELPLDGNANKTKWVFWGANGSYVLGDFDGKTFTKESDVLKLYAEGSAYAAQTFSDIPEADGRRIQIPWLRKDMPGMPFNQMMGAPVELTLRTTDLGIRMFALPVNEIEGLRSKTHSWKDEKIQPDQNLLADITGDLFDISAEFAVGNAEEFGITIRGIPIVYNPDKRELSLGDKAIPFVPVGDTVDLRILVDRASIELFANEGLTYWPAGVIPNDDDRSLAVFSKGGVTVVETLEVSELQPVWPKP